MATVKDFRASVRPNWCPGCGDFSVLAAIQRTAASLDLKPEEISIVSGIGCAGRISGYVKAYGFHGVHGRALLAAQGLKLANPEQTVIASGGDGDGFAIGMGHTIHAMRRNVDITYIVMDNQVYGLTKGQTSPRSAQGFKTSSTPAGSIEGEIAPLQLALSSGVSFLAQGFSSNTKELMKLIEAAIQHKGFSLINVFSPCVTYNKINTYDWFKENVISVEDDPDYDPHNLGVAMNKVIETDGLCTGLIYQNDRPTYQEQLPNYDKPPIVQQQLGLGEDRFNELLAEFV